MRKFQILFFFFLISSFSHAQLLDNYDTTWEDGGETSWFESNDRLTLPIDLTNFPRSYFSIKIPAQTVVFLGEKLWFFTERDTILNSSLIDLRNLTNSSKINLTLFKSGISIDQVSAKKFLKLENPEAITKKELIVDEKVGLNRQEIKDFFIFTLVLILILIAAYKSVYPYIFTVIARPLSLLNAEDFSDSGSLQKFFSFDVLFFVLLVNMISALVLVISVVFLKESWLEARLSINLKNLTIGWSLVSLAIFILTIIKFSTIRLMAHLFGLGKVEFSHFFYLLRLVLIMLSGLMLLLVYCLMNDFYFTKMALNTSLSVFFLIYILGTFVLFISMMNRLSFKKYHLFTYLCIAELVPFLILAKLVNVIGG
jgi:hypothetical protein